MSKKRTPTRCLVLDASVARAAGTLETQHPTGALCRDFLMAVRSVCHRMAWSEAIRAEWDEHQSAFAGTWLVSMMTLRKLRPVREEPVEELRETIRGHSKDEGVAAVMLKDAHLVEAALAIDFRVASLDDTVRGHYSRLTGRFALLRRVLWVNPAGAEEQAVDWLENGARADRFRKLKPR